MTAPESSFAPGTVREALARAKVLGLDRLDAQLLLAHHLQRPRSWLLAHDDAALTPAQRESFAADAARRADGVPIAYLLGQREFHGLLLQVTPDVLDPRPDTETLVEWALELLAGELAALPAPQVLDLGTGSGAIALAVKHAAPRVRMRALDASAAALAVARRNAQRLGLQMDFTLSDWWSALAPPRLHLALSNPPYIDGNDPHLAQLRHEPLQALTPGPDGMAAIECIVDGAPAHLEPGAWLLLEHGFDQGDAARQVLQRRGFTAVATRRDLAGQERCSGGRWLG
ncbi:peptide chain release factor N(5)-glutamine methyltransferase [uncultured Azohydromonas sp.]|mgnify:CR=1 FL=1|jgi:protein-(glutamine-N5) methyltransferase, release factor-specific|uniref:peptide chain release factor N(5)-glutamine methyltransferase n=1 Tax=uncultured Azohydromonas sp. TaxID=487342 RepID=UPI00260A92E1|nr:peptide chain release factor N(5)-glutamine methyltransferase [uncultured Azohydromonas sp.]